MQIHKQLGGARMDQAATAAALEEGRSIHAWNHVMVHLRGFQLPRTSFVVVPSGPPPTIPVHDIDIFRPRSRAVDRADPSRDPEGSRESFGRQPKRPFLHHVALRARRFVHVRPSWQHLPRRTSERRSAWCRRARFDTKERCISWTQRTPSWRSRTVSLAHALSWSEARHETL